MGDAAEDAFDYAERMWYDDPANRGICPYSYLEEPPMKTLTAANLGHSKESIIYKGDPGSGKTFNSATWPGPLKYAYFDRNLKTISGLIENGLDAELFIFDNFKEFEDEFVLKVLHREFEAETIVVDTLDGMAAMCINNVQGIKPKLTIPDWGLIVNKLRSICSDLTSAAAPFPDKPAYNIIFNYHLMDITNDDGALLKTVPMISGRFKDEIEAYVDTVLYCKAQISSAPVPQPGGGKKLVPSKQFLCHSVPPNPFITCKGGGLPPTLDGTYGNLMVEWGKKDG